MLLDADSQIPTCCVADNIIHQVIMNWEQNTILHGIDNASMQKLNAMQSHCYRGYLHVKTPIPLRTLGDTTTGC
jgi:hypothetical protein